MCERAYVCVCVCTAVYKARAYVHTSYVWRSSYYTPFMHRVRRRAALRRDESSIRLNARQLGDALNQDCLPEHTYTDAQMLAHTWNIRVCMYVRTLRPGFSKFQYSAEQSERDESENDRRLLHRCVFLRISSRDVCLPPLA